MNERSPRAATRRALEDDHPIRGVSVVDSAREYLGERLVEVRYDDDGRQVLYVLDLTDTDRDWIADVARRTGVERSLKVIEFASGWVSSWQDLAAELSRLATASRQVLKSWPGTDTRYRMPPHEIRLVGSAETVAAELHGRFGANVRLTVGALPYPPDGSGPARPRTQPGQPTSNAGLNTSLAANTSIRSGETALHDLRVHNQTAAAISVRTNGHLRADIVDPTSGAVVGTATGVERMPGVRFTIPSAGSTRIPVRIGTDSVDPALGYLVPPADWAVVVHLDLADGRRLDSPPLPITVTPAAS